jgi:hypothetical protein
MAYCCRREWVAPTKHAQKLADCPSATPANIVPEQQWRHSRYNIYTSLHHAIRTHSLPLCNSCATSELLQRCCTSCAYGGCYATWAAQLNRPQQQVINEWETHLNTLTAHLQG